MAVCDKELSGKTLSEGEICFEVKKSFYGEKELTANELRKLLHEHENINLVGEKSVSVALKENIVEERNIIRIQKIPHVQIFKI